MEDGSAALEDGVSTGDEGKDGVPTGDKKRRKTATEEPVVAEGPKKEAPRKPGRNRKTKYDRPEDDGYLYESRSVLPRSNRTAACSFPCITEGCAAVRCVIWTAQGRVRECEVQPAHNHQPLRVVARVSERTDGTQGQPEERKDGEEPPRPSAESAQGESGTNQTK